MKCSMTRWAAWTAALCLLVGVAGCGGEDAASGVNSATGESAANDGDEEAAGSSSGDATQQAADANDVQDDAPGLAVGEQAPAFELTDQHGESRALDGLLADGAVALVFYRSADW